VKQLLERLWVSPIYEEDDERSESSVPKQKSQLNAKRLVERLWVRPIYEEDVLSKAKNGSPEENRQSPSLFILASS